MSNKKPSEQQQLNIAIDDLPSLVEIKQTIPVPMSFLHSSTRCLRFLASTPII